MSNQKPRQPVKKGMGALRRDHVEVVEPSVRTSQYCYIVNGLDGFHVVHKNKKCICGHGEKCKAVSLVSEYLKDGGQRAEEVPVDYFPYVPDACPECGSPCESYARLDSKSHGTGWRCTSGGTEHFWKTLAKELIRLRKENQDEWLFPPVYSASNVLMYPGVRRIEVNAARDGAKSWYYLPGSLNAE